MKGSRELYDKFIQSSPQSSLYSSSWWLDIVTGGDWEVAALVNNDGIKAAIPYTIQRFKGGVTAMLPIPLSLYNGVLLRPCEGKYATRLSEQIELMSALIEMLPNVDYVRLKLHHSLQNWQPFFWKGFQQTTTYTYIIRDLSEESVWTGMRENIRREIKKAQRQLAVCDNLGMDAFFNVYAATFERQKMRVPYTLPFLKRLDEVCAQKGCKKLLFASDSQGNIHAAVYIVWDSHSAYYLMGGGDSELRTSGAHSLLMWEAIRHVSGFVEEFNFAGSMNQAIERFFRGFGAQQVPVIEVYKENNKYRIFRTLSSFLHGYGLLRQLYRCLK